MAKIQSGKRYTHFPLSLLRVILEHYGGDMKAAARDGGKYFYLWSVIQEARHRWQTKPKPYKAEIDAARDAWREFGLYPTSLSEAIYQSECETIDQLAAKAAVDRDPMVRVHGGIIRNLIDGNWSWTDFATYCAIRSFIGAKYHPVLIRYDAIIPRGNGYRSRQAMPPGEVPTLTIAKIRQRLDWMLENTQEGNPQSALLATFSHKRDRWYWLPGLCDEIKAMNYIKDRIDRQEARAKRPAASQERRSAWLQQLQKKTPKTTKPTEAPDTLTIDGVQYYSAERLRESCGDDQATFDLIVTTFPHVDRHRRRYYSATLRPITTKL